MYSYDGKDENLHEKDKSEVVIIPLFLKIGIMIEFIISYPFTSNITSSNAINQSSYCLENCDIKNDFHQHNCTYNYFIHKIRIFTEVAKTYSKNSFVNLIRQDLYAFCQKMYNQKNQRVALFYEGYNLPDPSVRGEFYLYNGTINAFEPLSINDLQVFFSFL